MWYILFCIWLLPFNMVRMRFAHALVCRLFIFIVVEWFTVRLHLHSLDGHMVVSS